MMRLKLPPAGLPVHHGIALALAGLLVLWLDYGAMGLMAAGLVTGLLLEVLGGGPRQDRRPNNFRVPRFGPTDREIDLDPLFKIYPHNIHHKS